MIFCLRSAGDDVNGCVPLDYTMESLMIERRATNCGGNDLGREAPSSSEDECANEEGRRSAHMSVSSEPISQSNRGMSALYHGTWPVERTMWNSEPTNLAPNNNHQHNNHLQEVTSVMSFASSSGGAPLDRALSGSPKSPDHHQLEAKVDMVYSLLAMLGGQEHADMGETLLALSTNPESCLAMRQSGCVPLLVQLVQSDRDSDTRRKASQALHNLVHSQADEKVRKREVRVLRLLEHARVYADALREGAERPAEGCEEDAHPVQTVAHLMKLSFDEGHRQAICQLGGIHILASLVEAEHANHGSTAGESHCVLMRRYACMALTNLTFGDSGNKALLCSYREFMRALVVQLQSPSDELRQVTASVLRNLSWRADSTSKDILREVGSVTGLMKAAMLPQNKENTLKSILSALWNLSAHCTENKSEICAVENALGFLVDTLTYKTPSKSLSIVENSGGILRNISSQIAVRDDYREILRQHDCLEILLEQLKSPSLTIVSNACGTLWNLSAKCAADQEALWKLGAPSMLRSLNHSKHKMIAMGSSAALKNLLSVKPAHDLCPVFDRTARALDLPVLPTLGARKQKALLHDLDRQNLSETYENIEKESPVKEGCNNPHRNNNNNNNKAPEFVYCNDDFGGGSLVNLGAPSTSGGSGSGGGYMSLPLYGEGVVGGKFGEFPPERPVDYGVRKYSEKDSKGKGKTQQRVVVVEGGGAGYAPAAGKDRDDIYAETDLDQPTDYSLRYAEDDSDSEICTKIATKTTEFIQDTLKTYCTEDTPYETPLNFSNATSMSDLRIVDNDKTTPKTTPKETTAPPDEKDRCSTEDISETLKTNEKKQPPPNKNSRSEPSSGMLTPEKPVNYCEEGTPGCFSRVSSFSSLSSNPVNHPEKGAQAQAARGEAKRVEKAGDGEKNSPPGGQGVEAKAVKFGARGYAELQETPLMFSRSSSMTSLDSNEQNSFHDDRSSVVSDFSRMTSGAISPSELPDSPFQTIPPSPRPRKNPLDYPSTSARGGKQQQHPQPAPRSAAQKAATGGGFFEDNVTKFKEENTPLQFSRATSLSNLTIDDDAAETQPISVPKQQDSVEDNTLQKEEHSEKQDTDNEKERTVSQTQEDMPQVSEDEGDEDILAACINSGMQNNRYCQSKPTTPTSTSKLPLSSFKYQQKTTPNISTNSGIPLPRTTTTTRNNPPPPNNNHNNNNIPDSIRTYCTEDTPAGLSRAGSNSDLSVLSIPIENRTVLLSDDSNLSEDNENLLAQCIQSAMPKPKKQQTGIPARQSGLPRRSGSRGVVETSCKVGQPQNNLCKFGGDDRMVTTNRNNNPKPSSTASANNYNIAQEIPRSSESTEVTEDDLALLSQCISLGIQKTSKENATTTELSRADEELLQQCITSAMPKQPLAAAPGANPTPPATKSKNGSAASVVANTATPTTTRSETGPGTTMATDGGNNRNGDPSPPRSGFNSYDFSAARRCEQSSRNDRMLDPDAMIESLDRFTAELVSQALNKEDKFRASTTENTWNEDSSPNELTFPSVSGSAPNVITFGSDAPKSHDDYTSTMTDSTLIAMEATKIANAFADLSQCSTHSAASLELDSVQPPSLMSPKLVARKRSLPAGLIVRRALSNSLNHSVESLDFSNLDQMNPPSVLGEVFDMEGSVNSVTSLPSDAIIKPNFLLNGVVNNFKRTPHEYATSESLIGLEQINPPSLLNEITDLNNSLADVQTEGIGSETEVFEDCYTHVGRTEDDFTEFSDANSVTPIQSDVNSSSNESTPKRSKAGVNKPMTMKQRRSLAKERYKTYTIGAEMIMKEEQDQSLSEDYKTANEPTQDVTSVSGKVITTPRERRKSDRSRYETRVIETSQLQEPPQRTKLSIRRSFAQKRLENRERFRTQTISESSVSSGGETDLHALVQKEADLVVKTLKETKTRDELLDCETLSLVSNDDDSENNSCSSVNYRTYHKSWGSPARAVQITKPEHPSEQQQQSDSDNEQTKQPPKPKIVKPCGGQPEEVTQAHEEPQVKGIRGRRKPLYAPKTVRQPIKTMTSNLVKNVTSTIKSRTSSKPPVTPRVYGASPGKTRPLERQGTFTKDASPKKTGSKIPTCAATSKIPTNKSKIPSKLPGTNNNRSLSATGSGCDRSNKNYRVYNRSTSADSSRKIQSSASNQSLKSEGAIKKTGSNSSLNSNGSGSKKQVTSKIASLWKRIEQSKKQAPKNDTRVWIKPEQSGEVPAKLIRSNTFDNKDGVVLGAEAAPKRGSFVVTDESDVGYESQQLANDLDSF